MFRGILIFIALCSYQVPLGAQEIERMPRTKAKVALLKQRLRDTQGEQYSASKFCKQKAEQTKDDSGSLNEATSAIQGEHQENTSRQSLEATLVALHYFAARETSEKLKGPFITTCSGVNPNVASISVLGRAKARDKMKRKLAQQSASNFTFQEVNTLQNIPDLLQVDGIEDSPE
jgi:hypothetical protein